MALMIHEDRRESTSQLKGNITDTDASERNPTQKETRHCTSSIRVRQTKKNIKNDKKEKKKKRDILRGKKRDEKDQKGIQIIQAQNSLWSRVN